MKGLLGSCRLCGCLFVLGPVDARREFTLVDSFPRICSVALVERIDFFVALLCSKRDFVRVLCGVVAAMASPFSAFLGKLTRDAVLSCLFVRSVALTHVCSRLFYSGGAAVPGTTAPAPAAGVNPFAAFGGLGGMGGMGGLPGLGGMDPSASLEMLSNPAVQSMVSSMMSNPEMMAQVCRQT